MQLVFSESDEMRDQNRSNFQTPYVKDQEAKIMFTHISGATRPKLMSATACMNMQLSEPGFCYELTQWGSPWIPAVQLKTDFKSKGTIRSSSKHHQFYRVDQKKCISSECKVETSKSLAQIYYLPATKAPLAWWPSLETKIKKTWFYVRILTWSLWCLEKVVGQHTWIPFAWCEIDR